jgi:PAS domain-containing protein
MFFDRTRATFAALCVIPNQIGNRTTDIDNGLALGQVANILDQASQWQRFNQNLIMTMIDHMTQGVSVVDENMCLVAWNNQYLKLFDYLFELFLNQNPLILNGLTYLFEFLEVLYGRKVP